MNSICGWVILVDDDPSVRTAIRRLLASHGFNVQTFDSARRFLNADIEKTRTTCLLLDVRLPDADGLDLQTDLLARYPMLPIIFITGYGDIPMTVRAMKRGAIDFLSKPLDEAALLDAVRDALRKAGQTRIALEKSGDLQKRVERLTPREYQVLPYAISGLLNKQIAYELGISEKTIKVHRARIMKKLGAGSVADLVRQAEMAGIAPADAVDHYR